MQSEYNQIAAAFARAKPLRNGEDAAGLKSAAYDAKLKKRRISQFKVTHGLLLAVLSWIFLLHAVGLFFFTKGFLLTRLVLEHKSECANPPIDVLEWHRPGSASEGCWHPKTFEKAVVIIIDALRYDFTVPFQPGKAKSTPNQYHDALPILYETAVQQPNNAFLLPFIADPPTTTLQRLQGLTTGTLPTFIDAGSNFAGTAIEEDNLVAQLRDSGKTLVHLGDDTWHSLFPGYFNANLTHKYDSFNVWDLHTVDNGVTEHLLPLLSPTNSSKWDVIFGHYLGVDHAGHRYGPDHPAMKAKLQQMNELLRKVMTLLDDRTLLVIMGDHGMDAKGDHGGESDDEVEAALWMYSKKPTFGRTRPDFIEPPITAKERPVGQIDIVSTLSLLLGMPIPFNNLGAPIVEAFVGIGSNDWQNLARVARLTGAQIKRYQHEYALARRLDSSATSGPLAHWDTAEQIWDNSASGTEPKPDLEQFQDVHAAFSSYQGITLSICRELWARFNVPSMVLGIQILTAGVILLIYLSRLIRGDITDLIPLLLSRLFKHSGRGAAIGTLLCIFFPSLPWISGLLLGVVTGGLAGSATWIFQYRSLLLAFLPNTLWGWLAVVFTISQSVGFASNSFTIWEDEILMFFLCTFGMMALSSSLQRNQLAERSLGSYHSIFFLFLTRLASLSRLCREEQMPHCKSTYYASATSSTSAPWQLSIPFISALVLPGIIKSFYKGTRSYAGSAVFWIDVAFRLGLLLTAIFWTLDTADDGDWIQMDKGVLKTSRVMIAQLIFTIAVAAGGTTFALAQPCVSIETSQQNQSSPNGLVKLGDQSKPEFVTILGYANVHGSRYFLLVINWLLAIILVQKPMGGGAIGILASQILSLLEVIDTNDLSQSSIGPIVFGLLGSFHFFKTGHQATLSSIQWESAFVPLHTIRYPWSPLLVVLNTYGAQILTTVAVPLIALWKQPPKKKGLLSDVAKVATTYILYYAVISLATTMWAGWLRRHLMLYRIFSPRFMMGACVLLFVDIVTVIVSVAGVSWNTLSVAEVFGWA
ncbi:MAG: mannose-ethanolamine phosphotransferase gpi13 [Candelina submexicana]|nr:MAG: mannose-ethanolamine phosphotransferase gpi13 [Candelina submexicana]